MDRRAFLSAVTAGLIAAPLIAEAQQGAKVARLGVPIYEVAVSYSGRTYAQGKKVNWRDGFSAIRCILKYNLGSSK